MNQPSGPREEKKQKTRQTLLDAALHLLDGEQSFASLSLREVTREAGIVPTAFYRHFQDMDELGLALVDESFHTLRQMMRAARSGQIPTEQMIRRSVAVFVAHVRAHARYFQFLLRERAGGRSALRNAIRTEVRLFVSELATDLARFPALNRWPTEDLQMMAGLIVGTMMNAVMDILDLPAGRPEDEREMARLLEKQLRLILLGAGQWKSGDGTETGAP
ncbi:MAG: HTH-type transcriptional repressor FabR [Pseudomonadota bacterium]